MRKKCVSYTFMGKLICIGKSFSTFRYGFITRKKSYVTSTVHKPFGLNLSIQQFTFSIDERNGEETHDQAS